MTKMVEDMIGIYSEWDIESHTDVFNHATRTIATSPLLLQ